MLSRPHASRRWALCLEELEPRLVPDGTGFVVGLDPQADQFGDQILTAQAYNTVDRLAFGIFDSGASAIAFSAQDQANFQAKGLPIPIKTTGGAMVEGIGGMVVGDVSMPGTILADGLHAVKISFDQFGQMQLTANLNGASVPFIQALVGTSSGSGQLPTITGTPILDGGVGAALVDFHGAQFDFSPAIPGLVVTFPDLHFVGSNALLPTGPGDTDPITVPLAHYGDDNSFDPGTGLTEASLTVQPDVQLTWGSATTQNKKFLFDTGAQMTIISPSTAQALSLDLSKPTTSITAQGVGGTSQIPGYTVDKLVLPSDQGPLEFDHVTVFVANVSGGLDGILGMNLFNTTDRMLYTYSGATPSVSFAFELKPKSHGPSVNEQTEAALQKINAPFAGSLQKAGLPSFVVESGNATGRVYQDLNMNGAREPYEAGLANVTVYVDVNNSGKLDPGDPVTSTDANGNYTLTDLVPGFHTVRIQLPANMIYTSPHDGELQVRVAANQTTTDWDFGVAQQAPDILDSYVDGLYASVLQRTPDPVGQGYFRAQLIAGVTPDKVAQTIYDSGEHQRLQVQQSYTSYLHRPADPAGQSYWGSLLGSGGLTILEMRRGILTSPEYLQAHASDNDFVEGLYQDVLGRASDTMGKAYWMSLLQAGVSRADVAAGVLTSHEAYKRGVDSFYQDYLGRAADAAGEAYWIAVLQSGQGTWSSVAASFLASAEYQQMQQARMGHPLVAPSSGGQRSAQS